jgi:hypothetical protein
VQGIVKHATTGLSGFFVGVAGLGPSLVELAVYGP